ncbi:MAG: 3-hydroxyacyl-ACP dehydratase FabZ family protein [Planctomycetia bacterium]|jgi:3-hydroxyacyl-[acyl-carrier-protein] dehydratase
MRFILLDRILSLESGKSIKAIKNLTIAEEYLGDHFPGFPVMPGVLMLEAMTEAGAWLVRESEDFAHSMVVLAEARNIKYGQFLQPGQTMTVEVELMDQTDETTRFKAKGSVNGATTVSGRLTLRRYNLADQFPSRAETDRELVEQLRNQFKLLYQPETTN